MNRNLPTIINGTAGDDILEGTPGIDKIVGFAGNDVLLGNEGHDFLFGDGGDDTLYGGEGHDFLLGGIGEDSLYGDDGSDNLDGGEGNDRLYGGAGSDILVGGDGNDLLYGGIGVDYFDGGEGNDIVYFRGENFAITADLSQNRATYINDAGVEVVETLINIERLVGTAFDDTLIGDVGNNVLYGENGNDTLLGGGGNDRLIGGTGVDFFDGGAGIDTVYFRGENSAVTADLSQSSATYINDAGVEIVETLINIENLVGTAFDDQLIGDAGHNVLYGEDGDDTLLGGEGNDRLIGGTGADYLDGGEGIDTVYFRGESFAITADLSQGNASYLNGAGVEIVKTLINIENLVGTAFDDTLIGDAGNNVLYGENGNDILLGGEGNDRLLGGTGVDFFDGGAGIDTVYFQENFAVTADLSQGNATYINDAGVEVLETLINIENLVGTAFDDQLIGDAANNDLHGSDGNDILIGGEGKDRLFGGTGVDFFDGGAGIDIVYFQENSAVTADLSQGSATYINDAGVEVVETLINIESLVGTAFNDTLIGDENNNWLRGDAGIDFFDGGGGSDTADFINKEFAITGDLNTETVTYTDANGNTIVETIRNIENLQGTRLDDLLRGNAQKNSLRGRDGNDTLFGGAGDDLLEGGIGADIFGFSSPNQGIDTITDFNSTQGDLIQISANDFGGGLTLGTLDIDQFTIGSAATQASDRFIYNDTTGALFFDPDGTGTLAQVQLAQLSGGVALSNNDIFVV
ncbi:MAG: calcium-binding protein [Symploca sp. SIO3E6]|nr:calcium-binding protein [Caldora sp. SIO3E6]